MPPIVDRLPDRGDAIVFALDATLGDQQYRMKTTKDNDRAVLRITGGSDLALLYGAYDLAEKLGVRFYMHGDVIPDERIALALPELDETRAPLFATRGIQPFHDFPEGPDWWNLDDYKAILGQLPKMRMNFFGLHTYPEGGVGPEPVVWIGLPEDVGPDGRVKAAYPSRHFATCNQPTFGQDVAAWGYAPTKTGDYAFGAATIFDRDDYGADYMRGVRRFVEMTPDETNALFDRMGDFLGEAFTFARRLGIKTCVGTETPMIIPAGGARASQETRQGPQGPGGGPRALRRLVPLDHEELSGRLLLALDARRLDVVGREAGARRGDAGRSQDGDGGGREGRRAVHAGHVRLGARTAERSGPVRQGSAQERPAELHQSRGRPRAGRTGIRQDRGPAEMGHPVDGGRPRPDYPATLGRTHARRRRRRAEVRLHRV